MTVEVDRSFSQETAARVARGYFHTFLGDCGDVDFAKEEADAWVFRTVVGFAADKGPDIVVSKAGTWVFTKGGAVCYWIDGRWRFDASRYRTFFHNDDVENG